MLSSTKTTKRVGALRLVALGMVLAAVAVACVPPDPGTPPSSTTTTTEAPAEDIEVTDATLSWSYSQYAQYGVFAPWSFEASGERVSITTANGQAITGLPAEAGKTYNVANFTGGTGELDPETGAGTISWGDTGDWVLNAYPTLPAVGAPDETLRDPILTINADGSGTLSFEAFIPAGLDMNGNPVPATGPTRIAIADFASLSQFTSSSLKATPNFAGRAYTPPVGESPFVACGGAGGSWPAAWVNFLPSSVRAHYYSTGCGGLQDRKPPTPFTVAWS
jgi:hypothetical protein